MKHQFALFFPAIDGAQPTRELIITDKSFIHRLTTVLRAKVGDSYILFSQHHHAHVLLKAITAKEIVCDVQWVEKNTILAPTVTFFLPILKKDALSETVYALCEIGVNKIQLISSEKTRPSGDQKELDRLKRVIVSAAEQSKNFAFPDIYDAIGLSEALETVNKKSFGILADQNGHSAFDVIKDMQDSTFDQIILTVGPEGAYTSYEQTILSEKKFHLMKLTPTILRARQAAAVLAGIIRSV